MSKEEEIIISKTHENIYINKDVTITKWVFPKHSFSCNIFLDDNVCFTSKQLLNIAGINGTIQFYSNKKTTLKLQLGIIFKGKNCLEIRNILAKNNSNSVIKIHAWQEDEEETILKTEGVIAENTKANNFLEEIKVLNDKNHKITCIPNLVVSSNEASANHNVTIKTFTEEEIFFMNTKGISQKKAQEIIKEGFLNSMLQ